MTGPEGNSEFCFPRDLMFPETKSRETLRFEGTKANFEKRAEISATTSCHLWSRANEWARCSGKNASSITILFIGFVKRHKAMVCYLKVFSRPILCLVSLDCRLRLLEYFSQSVSKTRNGFFFLIRSSRTCLMSWQDFFFYLIVRPVA